MRPAHEEERPYGIEWYASDSDGVGGRLRDRPADFRVRERERFDFHPVESDTGDYPWLVCRVTLENTDTNDFARELSNRLSMSRERVSWAGTKDKRAISTQLFTLKGVDPDAVPDIHGAEIEILGRAGRGLAFGDLLGNEFTVVVRNPDAPERAETITTELESRFGGRAGVPNYFGHQRFGSYRSITHEVGLAILRGDWEGAVMAYLGNPSPHEPTSTREAREFVAETRDWETALDRFPNRLRYERSMLHALVDSPADFRGALGTFPENLQRLFVNAAQSAVFNRILSRRLDAGLPFHEPVAGDVVAFADTDAPADFPIPDMDRLQRVSERRTEVMARHCKRDRAFVTAPLVGTETGFAAGEPGEIERTALADLGLDPADFDLPEPYHSTGTRRAVLLRVDPTIQHDPLTFEFGLPKGSYATILLREYLKVSPRAL
ncbi:tRNA pseudouridine(13) synthase TruD [Halodesulfurarchaeum sp. HSR-GB]|uniref:tRNA pseudouridine(13) synthase TruD n=1 Tax=Halodesulfurarchaeum sp. HSR-GB TaxID=3074077 RepID=UPI002855831C|nr:tRNA pseudouridine(13) synthase TruD [Halodesulfurarchaeum sp. HSR-GB]MDR5656741.1 tRNA pseudouridine(13) synthase TruD [Halodesulfurarchaeum sp. HSR-GB]